MLGLDDYGSSDDDDVQTSNPTPPPPPAKPEASSEPQPAPAKPSEEPPQAAPEPPAQDQQEEPAPGPALPPVENDAPVAGPAAGPAPGPSALPAAAAAEEEEEAGDEAASAPLSPYSTNRALIRTLTMPRAPNFDIPPSPPGSPPRDASKKFSHFLKLKEQGQHFNKRLEDSSALRNPSLLKKLLGFAGISDEAQYASTLPDEVAVPTRFLPEAYADQLAKTQQEITRKREEEQRKTQREAVEFVSEGAPRAAPGGVSMAERVRAGLSRDGSASSSGPEGRARDGERRGEKRKSRFDERERSPRRR
ncbi:uncharacterized protein K452DRAFT_250636 [Aplosporella prunicola CBS 121167]|uniref:HCNGP-like protein n=1 Tax=Aplosporella prunicola CBS 121167 TaxID=1176127 RepID=A0A6A6BC39_9PEZI|nr:uncharacterized protein K452DRAFT_250636 [Aplosporella prunicola CBS 121167]KAF2141792.1 hypothetical protein K452DRAFT_250636 [Aplosporella prunicola CBS 121167]